MIYVTKMATVSGKTEKGGFDCEFVEKPPEAVQSECPVCLQILCEPYQISCCGNSFCRVCIERIKTDNKPCPTCNEENFVTFNDKRLRRSLYGFQVYCSHKQEGCEWKGELGQLDNHLNLSPQPDKQLEGCEYSEIECIYCSELIKRSKIGFHQTELCPKRPFSCEYCHSYETHYEDVINSHWPVCGYHPVQCPNECGTFPLRQALQNHTTRDCPKTVIDCDFHHVGCDVRLPRKDMPAHLKENLVTHMSLQAASYSKLLASHNKLQASHTTLQASHNELQVEVIRLKNENETLQCHQVSTMASHVTLKDKVNKPETANTTQNTGIPILSYVEFTMENYEKHKRNGNGWYSPPIYTHPGGYNVCLSVDANGVGSGRGTHVSVGVCVMKGEFDDQLKWPFRGQITVQIVNQEGKKHYTETIHFTDKTPDIHADRVTQGERNNGWGFSKFISHEDLESKHLKHDNLCFRVTKIKFDC